MNKYLTNTELFLAALDLGLILGHVDIETSPYLVWTYPLYDVNIQPENIEVPMQITSIGWMFEGDKKVSVEGWDNNKNFLKCDKDKKLLKKVVPKLQLADILIGQNLKAYDVKKVNWRLCEHKIKPLGTLVPLDILKESRKVFSPPSNKLDFKSSNYGFGGKIPQSMRDCIQVAKGNKEAQKNRCKYNGKDVEDERAVFWRELDYYNLPIQIINMLRLFIKTKGKPDFCIRCAALKKAKLNIVKDKQKYFCYNCGYSWGIK